MRREKGFARAGRPRHLLGVVVALLWVVVARCFWGAAVATGSGAEQGTVGPHPGPLPGYRERGEEGAIRWDRGTLRLIERGADYGRMVRLGDGGVACVYDAGGKMWFRRSGDGGRTFEERVMVAEGEGCWLTNAFLLPVRDGGLLYFWNERPREALRGRGKGEELARPFRIRVARSGDGGRTWSEGETLYKAGVKFGDGCWEPAAIEREGGEVEVYFANEGPYRESEEQEISRMVSRDGGKTWGKVERVGFRAGHRDGMPGPVVLASGEVVVAVEDNGLSGERFKIAVLRVAREWDGKVIGGEDGRREGALAVPLKGSVYAGAPFLVKLQDGRVVMSCQESEDGELAGARMAVYVGDEQARGFGGRTLPLGEGAAAGQLWNSLFVRDGKGITAVMTATVEGVRGVWAVDGEVGD